MSSVSRRSSIYSWVKPGGALPTGSSWGGVDLSTTRSGEMRVTLLGTEAVDNLVDELEGLSIDAFLRSRVG